MICHDRREWTVPMLREVLPEVRRRGFGVVGVTELLRRTGGGVGVGIGNGGEGM